MGLVDLTVAQVEELVDKNIIIVGDNKDDLLDMATSISAYLDSMPALTSKGSKPEENLAILGELNTKEMVEDVFNHRELGGKNTVFIVGRENPFKVLSELTGKSKSFFEELNDVVVMIDQNKVVELAITEKLF